MQKCPDCHSLVDDDAIFCDQCGFQLRPKPSPPVGKPESSEVRGDSRLPSAPTPPGRNCPACGYLNPAGESFCANCGVSLVVTTATHAQPMDDVQSQARVVSRPVAGVKSCPTCGANNPIGETYCQSCGFSLKPPKTPPAQPVPAPVPLQDVSEQVVEIPPALPVIPAGVSTGQSPFETVSAARLVGRLYSAATNTSLPLPATPEIIIGRRDPEKAIYPEVDLSGQGPASSSVSRQHARLLLQGNQVFVEDLNSTNSTYLNRRRLQPGQRYLLNPGDELRLGGVVLIFYTS